VTIQLLTADEVLKQSNTRLFYQPGGDGQRTYFGGNETQYMLLSGVSNPIAGSVDPVYVHDPRRPGRYRLITRTKAPADLPTATVTFMERPNSIPNILMRPQCPFNLYEVHGRCRDLSDWAAGWDGYILVYASGIFTGLSMGDRATMDSDDPLKDEAEATYSAIYPVGAINYGTEAATDVVVEVIDVVYGDRITCGNCGAINDGSQHVYALTRANVGSPGAPGQIIYTTDGGITWTTNAITGIGTTNEPAYLDIAGQYLLVGTVAGTGLFISPLNLDTAAPGTWSSVTLPVAMADVWVQSPRAIYFVGASSRVYRTFDITAAPTLIADGGTANAFARVDGDRDTIVAVGAAGSVYKSTNNGSSWSFTTAPAAVSLTAVQVISDQIFYVGSSTGRVWRTVNGGASWTEVFFPGNNTGAVRDILFATPQAGYILHDASSTANLITTLDGGYTWHKNDQTSRTLNWPTAQKFGRIAAPVAADPAVAANYTAVAGLAAGGTDGILVLGVPSII
jgi:photosystem II stability/assembly factor-like uncharacterized protein